MERIALGDTRKLVHNHVIRKCDQGLVSEDWALRKPMHSRAERRVLGARQVSRNLPHPRRHPVGSVFQGSCLNQA